MKPKKIEKEIRKRITFPLDAIFEIHGTKKIKDGKKGIDYKKIFNGINHENKQVYMSWMSIYGSGYEIPIIIIKIGTEIYYENFYRARDKKLTLKDFHYLGSVVDLKINFPGCYQPAK